MGLFGMIGDAWNASKNQQTARDVIIYFGGVDINNYNSNDMTMLSIHVSDQMKKDKVTKVDDYVVLFIVAFHSYLQGRKESENACKTKSILKEYAIDNRQSISPKFYDLAIAYANY